MLIFYRILRSCLNFFRKNDYITRGLCLKFNFKDINLNCFLEAILHFFIHITLSFATQTLFPAQKEPQCYK